MLRLRAPAARGKAGRIGVGDERRIERVVLVVVPLDLFAQRAGAAGAPHAGTLMRTAAAPARCPRRCRGLPSLAWIDCSCCWIARTALSFRGTRLSSTSVPPRPCASSRADRQHELERGLAVGDARHIEQQRDAAGGEMLHLLGKERRGLVVVEREKRLPRLVAVVEHAVGLELEAGALGELRMRVPAELASAGARR